MADKQMPEVGAFFGLSTIGSVRGINARED